MDAFKFNLASEPWVPCIMADGTPKKLSLIELFKKSEDIMDITDSNPLIRISIIRTLLAIVHRSIPTIEIADLDRIWNSDGWQPRLIIEYLRFWEHRFDLFDANRPFFQISGQVGDPTSISKLAFDRASGHNAVLFDHSTDESPKPVSPSTAAMLLLYNQAFNLSAGKSRTGHTKDAPISRCMVVLIRGRDLAETLKLNLVLYNPKQPRLVLGDNRGQSSGSAIDLPVWERQDDIAGSARYATGYLDLLTWPSRCIRLIPENLDGRTVVRKVIFSQGVELLDQGLRDPMIPHVLKKEDNTTYGMRLQKDKAVWRNLESLLMTSRTSQTSYNVTLLLDIIQGGMVTVGNIGERIDLNVCGLISPGQAKIEHWVDSAIPIPFMVLKDQMVKELVMRGLESTDHIAGLLRTASYVFANELIQKGMDGKADPRQVSDFLDNSNVIRDYWGSMEIPYLRFLNEIDHSNDPAAALDDWINKFAVPNGANALLGLLKRNDSGIPGMKAGVAAREYFYKHIILKNKAGEHNGSVIE
jgi:CRISPR system Cascade subunit CasA